MLFNLQLLNRYKFNLHDIKYKEFEGIKFIKAVESPVSLTSSTRFYLFRWKRYNNL